MPPDRQIGRYRRWYARLLRLYPRPYRDRFGEPMSQTFADLARERSDANRSLIGFVVATFAETAIQIVRENAMHRRPGIRHYLRWVLFTAVVLLVPLLAMVLRIGVVDPGGSGVEGVNWGPIDFLAAGVLILGAGLLYEYASGRSVGVARRVAVGIAVGAGLLLVWANLAVGLIGRDGHPANLLYLLVLGVALGGALVSRFAPARPVRGDVRDRERADRDRRLRRRYRAARHARRRPVLRRRVARIRPALPAGSGHGPRDLMLRVERVARAHHLERPPGTSHACIYDGPALGARTRRGRHEQACLTSDRYHRWPDAGGAGG